MSSILQPITERITPPKQKRRMSVSALLKRRWERIFPPETANSGAPRPWRWPWETKASPAAAAVVAAEMAGLRAADDAAKISEEEKTERRYWVRQFIRIASDTMANHGVCYRKMVGTEESVKYVEFLSPIDYQYNYAVAYARVDTRPGRLPRGVTLEKLRDQNMLDLIATNCSMQARRQNKQMLGFSVGLIVEYEPGKPLVFCFLLEPGAGRLPAHITYDETLLRMQAAYRNDNYSYPVGVGTSGVTNLRLVDANHILICGAPDSGKSNELNMLLCHFISRNSPQQLRIVLTDMKGGLELTDYADLPHILPVPKISLTAKRQTKKRDEDEDPEDESTGADELDPTLDEDYDYGNDYHIKESREMMRIVTNREWLPGALYYIVREGERRMKLLRGVKGCRNWQQFNSHKRGDQKLPVIFFVIDELADAMLTKRVGDSVKKFLTNASNRLRATGIYFIVATQTPEAEVLPMAIRNALQTRIVFRLNDSDIASRLKAYQATQITKKGRCVYVDGKSSTILQTPYMPPTKISAMVKAAEAGISAPAPTLGDDLTDMEIFRWSIASNDGNLQIDRIYDAFRDRRLSNDRCRKFVANWVTKKVVVDGMVYEITPGAALPGRGARPTRMVLIGPDTTEETEPEQVEMTPDA